jgi:hypothetical protein
MYLEKLKWDRVYRMKDENMAQIKGKTYETIMLNDNLMQYQVAHFSK